MGSMATQISRDLVDFVESGVSVLVGSRDAELRPDCQRGFGATVGEDRASLTVYLNAALADAMTRNFRDNGAIAVTFSRPIDHRTFQVKGTVTRVRDAAPEERERQERYLAAFVEHLCVVGLPRSLTRRFRVWPAVAIEMTIDEVFVQTPGPGAGRRVEEGGT